MPAEVDFWFSVGSTYTYLTVMRIGQLAAVRGLKVHWKPFSVRALMIEQNNIPFRDKPVKARYMWRDIERRADRHGLTIRAPAPYPLTHWDRINRLALLAAEEGWCEPFVHELYRRWFQLGEEPGVDERRLAELITSLGQEPERVFAAGAAEAMDARYASATDTARSLGLFGSPSFMISREVFWGDDRLEDALDWAQAVERNSEGET